MISEMHRTGDRTAVRVAVDLSATDVHTAAQQGITENVSPRGARVVTSKPLHPNDRVIVRSLLGNLRSRARVVYCQALKGGTYAVGLELFVKVGEWTLPQTTPKTPARPRKPQ